MTTPTLAPARSVRPQITLAVLRREQLSPHLVRIVLSGEQFEKFVTNESTDKYVKIYFAKPELGLTPPFDVAALRDTLAPEDLPVTRTYTVRQVDLEARTLSIDFVVHGDEGLAGPWADAAQPGDLLTFSGPGGGYAPDPASPWHLFAGDQSALPAIASALAALPATAAGLAFIQVASANEILELAAPGAVQIQWLFGTDPGDLSIAVDAATWLPGRPQVFAHGERSAMKGLREVFSAHGVLRGDLSLSGYWAQGRTEDRFQAEKREPVGQILPVPEQAPTPGR
jgi:NADPH-dependent ferric siderophore reductase